METPTHPMDSHLLSQGWKRVRLDDLKGESDKLAATILCRALPVPGARPLLVYVDAHLWLQGDVVRMEMPGAHVPPFLMFWVAQGLIGVTPHGVGLVPCNHEPWHWNPFALPLVWQPDMVPGPSMNHLADRYYALLLDPSWQCPDAVRFLR